MIFDNSIVLVGRATGLDTRRLSRILLGIEESPIGGQPFICWQILVDGYSVNLRARDTCVFEQLLLMREGHPIKVTAHPPPPSSWPASRKKIAECTTSLMGGAIAGCATYELRLDSPGLELSVTHLELLGKLGGSHSAADP